MEIIIKNQIEKDVVLCECGGQPEFIQPDIYYTDLWLKCKKCEKRTKNTGGYRYASEIPLIEAKEEAVRLWNKRELCR